MDPLAYLIFGIIAALIIGVLIGSIRQGILYKEAAKKYKEKYERELHFRKSSEVRLGKIGENLAPFLQGWPWSPRQFRFLGNPVDGIQFNKDEIIFVEIKTGKARLSNFQKATKKLVKEGKVRFVTFKIGEDGAKLIEE